LSVKMALINLVEGQWTILYFNNKAKKE